MFCSQCGTEITTESMFCSKCGAQLELNSTPQDTKDNSQAEKINNKNKIIDSIIPAKQEKKKLKLICKIAMVVIILAIGFLIIFPPWEFAVKEPRLPVRRAGPYSFIWSTPSLSEVSSPQYYSLEELRKEMEYYEKTGNTYDNYIPRHKWSIQIDKTRYFPPIIFLGALFLLLLFISRKNS